MNLGRLEAGSDKYKKWRNAVMRLSGYKCAKCGSKKKLEAHHIKRWADCVSLRYIISNGIALCETCHLAITGREGHYEEEFKRLVAMRDFLFKSSKTKTKDKTSDKKKKWVGKTIGLRY